MPRRIIGEEVAAKALRLHRQGLSNRAIGAALGIDPRTAKNRVQQLAAEEQADHWKGVEQMVDAKYVDEHYQLLLCTSSGVLRTVETHPRNSVASTEALLTYHVGVALSQSKEILVGRGIVLMSGPEEEVEIPEKVSQSLLDGLKEHEQPLASALDGSGGWVKKWQNFQAARQELIEEAQRLLSRRGCQNHAAARIAEAAVAEMTRSSNAKVVGNRALHPSPLTDELKGADYRWILEQISLRQEGLRQADTGVIKAASLLKKEILRLQLRGRPRGECPLCPSRGGA